MKGRAKNHVEKDLERTLKLTAFRHGRTVRMVKPIGGDLLEFAKNEWEAFRQTWLEYDFVFMQSYYDGLGENDEVVQLAGGEDVPKYLVDALDALEKKWPGATLKQARPAIVSAILKAQKKR